MAVFTESGDLLGIQRAQNIKYMRVLRWALRCIAAWPNQLTGHTNDTRFTKCFLSFTVLVTLVSGILFIKNNLDKLTFFEMGHNYITVFMNVVTVNRGFIIFSKNYTETFTQFVNEIHLFNHRNKSPFFMKMHQQIHKLCHFFTMYMMAVMLWGLILFNLVPLYNTIANGAFIPSQENVTYETSVNYAVPFDYQHNLLWFIVINIFNWYISYVASTYFCVFDLLLALMMFHLWGHLKILIYNLENFPRPAPSCDPIYSQYKHYTFEELKHVRQQLKDIVVHHNLILKYTDDVSNSFGYSIALSYAFHQVSCCVLLVECSQLDSKALIRYGPLTLILLQLLIQMSVIFELINSLNQRLINAVYYLPWEYMDTSNRKSVIVILRQVQIPMGLKALGMVEVGCRTMVTILKTSISYFIMLRTMALKE
ncbi:uncharacterized LOC106130543 [Amyelois transitella]|uniref:Odorant receptor n=1 Tax=Amyelois transitella TaxID=680683 RepID=J7FT76_AMYTR|nr:uncharacterized LOC106130543 [Amyelois transitella]AFP54147.1 odorant receptor 3 [Amyelois transitella]